MRDYFKTILNNKSLLWQLTKQELRSRYLGSYLGVFWAFIQPVLTILIYWFVFQVGFRTVPINDIPFFLWFMAGIVPWFYFSDAVSAGTYSIMDNTYLVKKVVFPIQLLSFIKIASSLLVHLFFVAALLIVTFVYQYGFSWYYLQLIYYSACLSVLLIGLSWITSSIMVFLKDVGQFVNMLLQLLFWLTPILWNLNVLPATLEKAFKLNPLYYIVEGYRDSLFHHIGFWHHAWISCYFWATVFLILLLGQAIFKKLRPHFADVL